MINNIWFQIITGKINKNSRILHDVARQNTRLHNKTTRSRPDRGQNLETEAEAEAEAKASKPKPKFCPRGHFGLEDLTSLYATHWMYFSTLCSFRWFAVDF